jgi:hypothetical protein
MRIFLFIFFSFLACLADAQPIFRNDTAVSSVSGMKKIEFIATGGTISKCSIAAVKLAKPVNGSVYGIELDLETPPGKRVEIRPDSFLLQTADHKIRIMRSPIVDSLFITEKQVMVLSTIHFLSEEERTFLKKGTIESIILIVDSNRFEMKLTAKSKKAIKKLAEENY